MATITRSKTWVSNETLTASDLNAEFDNVLTGANSLNQANLSKTDDYTMGSLIVGTGITSTDGDSIHIHPSSAGSVTAHTTGDELVIEKGTDVGMSFLCPANASASIFFGDDEPANNKGSIVYDHGTDMAFTVEATEVLSLSATVATLSSQLTVGVNDTGHDVKFFGATSGAYWLWDESADGVVQIGTLTVGVDDAGHDVKFFGDAASAFMLWDTSTDDLVLGGAAQLYLYDAGGGEHISSDGTDLTINSGRNINLTCASGDVVIPANIGLTFGSGEKIEGDDTDLTVTSGGLITLTATGNTVVTNALVLSGATQANSTITVGSDGTGHDVKLFSEAAGAFALWDESVNLLEIRGATAAGPGHLKLTTGETTVVDGNILGRIDFQAPVDSAGTDAILVAASIWAEANATFSSSVNTTDLVFATGTSAAATEKMRLDSIGTLYIGDTANANMTTPGVTIKSSAGTQVFTLKGAAVDTGITTGTSGNNIETDDYFTMGPLHASHGGTAIKTIMADGASNDHSLKFLCMGADANTAKNTTAKGLVTFDINETDGTNEANVTANGNLFSIRTGTSIAPRFLVDEDGDMWTVTDGQTFDDYDDTALLDSYDAIRSDYREWTKQEEGVLIKTGILGAPLAEGGLTCVTQLQRALVGNARQMASRMSLQQEEIESLKQELRLLRERN